MTVYNIHDAKTQLSKLIALAEMGQDVIIARDGTPVVKLSSLADTLSQPRVFGQFNGLASITELDALFEPEMESDVSALFESAAAKPLKTLSRTMGKTSAAE